MFPYGFPGVGYRLNDWQFDRYRAGLEEAMLGADGRQRAQRLFWVGAVCLLSALGFSTTINFLDGAGLLVSEYEMWLRAAAVLGPAACALACLALLNRQALAFARPFVTAPNVSRFAHLRTRFTGTLVGQGKGLLALHLLAFVPLSLAVYLASVALVPANDPLIIALFGIPLAVYALWRCMLVFLYWSFRRRHGRAPRPEDLQPVEAPSLRAG